MPGAHRSSSSKNGDLGRKAYPPPPLYNLLQLASSPLIWRSKDPKFMVAMGQIMLLKKEALLKAGGFEAIRNSIVDDMDLCTNIKKSGGKVIFTDASEVSTCRMYDSAKSVWEGFSKNIYEVALEAKQPPYLGLLFYIIRPLSFLL